MKNKTLWWIIGIIIVIVVLFAWSDIAARNKNSSMTTRQVAMSCTTDALTQFHIHPLLKIVIDGQDMTVPAEIGITDSCMHPIHTHDNTGMIHIESPVKRDFTLGDFFAVWGQTLTKDQILNYKADATHALSMTVNGQSVDTFENTILRDGDQIVIAYQTKK